MNNKVIALSNELALNLPDLKTQDFRLFMYILYRVSNDKPLIINNKIDISVADFKQYFTSNVSKQQIVEHLFKLKAKTKQFLDNIEYHAEDDIVQITITQLLYQNVGISYWDKLINQ